MLLEPLQEHMKKTCDLFACLEIQTTCCLQICTNLPVVKASSLWSGLQNCKYAYDFVLFSGCLRELRYVDSSISSVLLRTNLESQFMTLLYAEHALVWSGSVSY